MCLSMVYATNSEINMKLVSPRILTLFKKNENYFY